MHSFLRTFHPVGQGAFYTEQHLVGSEQLTVVYDCGSLTGAVGGASRDFLRKVTSALPRGTVIDLLFISHFHEDHVNGLATLKKQHPVRAVVLPKLSEEARILVRLENYLEFGDAARTSRALLDNPRAFFGKKTLLIFVEPVQPGTPPAGTEADSVPIEVLPGRDTPIEVPPSLRSQDLTPAASISSGTAIRLHTKAMRFWEYVPFNYEYPTRHRQLLTLLATLRTRPADLTELESVLERKKDLTAAYAKLPGKLNQNSLVVYAGPLGHAPRARHRGGLGQPTWHRPTVAGCLYLGDAELKAPAMTSHLRTHLGTRWLRIGTLQVAHHGAVGNFSPAVVQARMQAVISYGTDNQHGHPSAYVVGHLHRLSATPVLVNEALESGFYSHFTLSASPAGV